MFMLLNILPFVKDCVRQVIRTGHTVIDATTGNGHDTVFLAQCVGEEGKVLAFDIQSAALNTTKQKLIELGLFSRVSLIKSGHEQMQQYCADKVSAIMFNLGYLPGADKICTTQAATTLQALQAGIRLLAINGLISIVLYPGHAQGKIEAQVIEEWATKLPQQQIAVLQYRFTNRVHNAPYALILQKKS